MPISEPIIVATEVEDGDWSVLVMCSQVVPGNGVSSAQTTGMSNEGRFFFFFFLAPKKAEMLLPAKERMQIGQKYRLYL